MSLEEPRTRNGGGFSGNSALAKEAGRKGGDIVKGKYGTEYFSAIGKAGGEKVKATQDADFYSRIGKIGGERRGINARERNARVKEEAGGDDSKPRGKPGRPRKSTVPV
jgi:general stress protein YciG